MDLDNRLLRPWIAALTAGFFLALAGASRAADGAGQVTVRTLLQSSPLAGYRYHWGKKLWPYLQVGDRLTLVREPDNPHDANAIRVDWYDFQLGYVPRRENGDLARLMDSGALLQGRIARLRKTRAAWERLHFDVYLESTPK